MNYIAFMTICKDEGVGSLDVRQDLWVHTQGKGRLTEAQVHAGARKVAEAMHPKPKTGIIVPTSRGWKDSSNLKR